MIGVHAVSKRFGRVTAIDELTLEFPAGSRVAIVGTNGSGKTTLLRAICGLIRVEGTIEVCGHDVARAPHLALQHVAYVPQLVPPLEAPVHELIRAFCALRGLRAETVAEVASRLGLSFQAIEKVRVRDLSGGMKQKLVAAMALSCNPRILVCDEPTANLDARARAAFVEQVLSRPKESSLLLCSHRVEEVTELVDRVIEMSEGQVTSDELLASARATSKGAAS